MKEKVKAYVLSLGGSASYSGRTQTMFIKNPKNYEGEPLISLISKKFGSVPFKIEFHNAILKKMGGF